MSKNKSMKSIPASYQSTLLKTFVISEERLPRPDLEKQLGRWMLSFLSFHQGDPLGRKTRRLKHWSPCHKLCTLLKGSSLVHTIGFQILRRRVPFLFAVKYGRFLTESQRRPSYGTSILHYSSFFKRFRLHAMFKNFLAITTFRPLYQYGCYRGGKLLSLEEYHRSRSWSLSCIVLVKCITTKQPSSRAVFAGNHAWR